MELHTQNGRRRQQVITLCVLLLILLIIIFNPLIRVSFKALRPSPPMLLGSAEIQLPKGWLWSTTAQRLTVWKPCSTMLCGSAQASFVIEATDPAMSEEMWQRAARKAIRENNLTEPTTRIINGSSGQIQCLELDSTPEAGRVTSTCLNSNLHVTSTFSGKPSFRPMFYSVLAEAHRAS